MSQKHLKELLKEEQEPFQLKDYIADKKKEQLVLPNSKLQLKKAKPISKTTSILCKNACFFSIQDSPDIRKSPKFFDFPPSPISHSSKSPNRVFLHVPAKTAAILLEAAVRIQKQRSKPKPKPKPQIKNSGLGLFGSVLKRLSLRNKTQKIKPKTEVDDENRGNDKIASVSSSSTTTTSSSSTTTTSSSNSTTTSFSCSCSLDLDSSSSGRSLDDDEFEFTNVLKENHDFNYDNNNGDYYSAICLSPFRFALHTTTPSPERRSPAKSPLRRKFEDNVRRYDQKESLEEDEEDKEQNSPVSVLDPPFEDDYEGQEEEEDSDDVECSYAYVHRSQQELLHRLHRFEKLAELDPIELEKRMIEEEEEEYLVEHVKEFERTLMQEVIRKTGLQDVKKPGIKRLISDLIIEEECEEQRSEEQVVKRVCNRLESWKEVESNTIDMMVEMDLRKEIGDWKKSRKEFNEAAIDIEVAIFAVLVDELVQDLA